MTDDYKSLVLKYLTGTIAKETGQNIPLFDDIQIKTNNLYTYCENNFSSYFTIRNVIQSTTSDKLVVWGNDWNETTAKTNSKILILDNNFNVIQKIETYTSDVMFQEFIDLKVDNSGNFYLLEKFDGSYRFLLLNNISLKLPTEYEYYVKIRKSYTIPSEYQSNTFKDIIKSENNDSYYCFTGVAIPNNKAVALELRINVGSSNEWKFYTTSTLDYIINSKGTAFWDSQGNINIKIGAVMGDIDGQFYFEFYNNGDNLVYQQFNTELHADVLDMIFLGDEIGYISLNDMFGFYGSSEEIKIYKINYKTKALDKMYSKKFNLNTPSFSKSNFFLTDNKQLFFCNVYPDESQDTSNNYLVEVGKIINNNYYLKGVCITEYQYIPKTFLFVKRGYDLYTICFQNNNTVYYSNQIYNEFNYNGEKYVNTNSLKPKYGVLYNDSNEILYARNLYNLTLNLNSSTSTLEILNQYLNDINIKVQGLCGETKQKLVSNNKIIIKNIYERLLINFQNTLTIYENTIANLNNSIILNNSINKDLNYNDIKMTKYRINYKTKISDTYWNGDSTIYWNGNSNEVYSEYKSMNYLPNPMIRDEIATYEFNVYTAQGIDTIELLSENEKVKYFTIDLSNCDKDKIYKITQEVEVI